MPNIEHNVPNGKLARCQITGAEDLFLAIDLGHQPPCDAHLTPEMLDMPEKTYPLRLMISPSSGSAQLDYMVDGSEIYYPDYPYRSGISKPLADYQRVFADDVVKRFALAEGSLVVDIGSNDGTLLTGFVRNGMKVLGVEPTNIAKIAREENGIETIQEFFDEDVAKKIVKQHGKAKIIITTNVFAHMTTLGDVMRGIAALIDENDGVFILENQYLLDVLEKNQFEGIYHEHIRTYSLKALTKLFPYYGMEVFDVQRATRYGGNIRAYAAMKGTREVSPNVVALLREEEEKGLFDPKTWEAFRGRVEKNRLDFMALAYQAKKEGKKFVGASCPGRGTVLLKYYGLNKDLMPYIAEITTGLKIGRYMTGTHIPVVSNEILWEDNPEYVVILAWHYADYIIEDFKKRGLKAKFVVPLPEFRIVE
jgi:SAM-dependent methyltransferase